MLDLLKASLALMIASMLVMLAIISTNSTKHGDDYEAASADLRCR